MTRARRLSLCRIAAAGALIGALALPVHADPADRARAAAQALTEATEALERAARGTDRAEALTRSIRAYEDGLEALRTELRAATLRQATLQRRFDARSTELSRILGVLATIGQVQSGPAQLAHPAGPLGTARAGMLLTELTPALRAEAEALGAELREARALREARDMATAVLLDGLETAQAARAELRRAMSDRTDLPQDATASAAIMAALADTADTLDEFARGLAARGGAAPDGAGAAPDGFAQARGTLTLPVRGTLLRAMNEADAAGIARPGIVLATAPGALVTAPWAATVRYAGPLRGHDHVVILEPADGHLLVIGGLAEAHVGAGDIVARDTALGLMPEPDDHTRALVTGERTETLYLEMRRGGEPVDPGPWFALTEGGD